MQRCCTCIKFILCQKCFFCFLLSVIKCLKWRNWVVGFIILSVCLSRVNQENDPDAKTVTGRGDFSKRSLNELWPFLILGPLPGRHDRYCIWCTMRHICACWCCFSGEGVMIKQLQQSRGERKPFTYEFHSWIKGRIEMESIISLSLSRPLVTMMMTTQCPLEST